MNGPAAGPSASAVGKRKNEPRIAPPNQAIAAPTCTIRSNSNTGSISFPRDQAMSDARIIGCRGERALALVDPSAHLARGGPCVAPGACMRRCGSRAPVAQWIERWVPDPKVAGSSPVGRATPHSCDGRTCSGSERESHRVCVRSRTGRNKLGAPDNDAFVDCVELLCVALGGCHCLRLGQCSQLRDHLVGRSHRMRRLTFLGNGELGPPGGHFCQVGRIGEPTSGVIEGKISLPPFRHELGQRRLDDARPRQSAARSRSVAPGGGSTRKK